jgi:ParB/RepB/Spo0J family partition protein
MDQITTAQITEPVAAPVVVTLPLQCIAVSPTEVQAHRRRHYDQVALAELAQNIKSVQVIEPIIVRALQPSRGDVAYEIVAGERRWRASQQAGLASIPAIVRRLDDRQVVELQLVENLHREGLHALFEAEGYETLLQQHGFTVDDLVAKFGKSRAYVCGRLKLLALTPKARAAFHAGKLTPATSLLMARIPVPKLQDEALKLITESYRGEPLSLREAQHEIAQRYLLRLREARFDPADATLLPAAGACGNCPKRSGNQPELFGDVKDAEVCTDPICFAAKRAAWSARVVSEAEAAGHTVLRGDAARRIAPHGMYDLQGGYVALDQICYADHRQRRYRALIGKALGEVTLLEEPRSGEFFEVVALRDYLQTLKEKGVGVQRDSDNRAEHEARRAREQAARLERTWRERLFAAVRVQTPETLAGADLRLITQKLWRSIAHDTRQRLVRLCGWAEKGKTLAAVQATPQRIAQMPDNDLRRLLLDCALADEVHTNTWDSNEADGLLGAAQRLNIDACKLREAVQTEANQKAGKRRVAPAAAKRKIAPRQSAARTKSM